jgi:hypothetical protein
MRWHGIPTTSPERTITELAATLEPKHLARAFHEARIKHGTTAGEVLAVLSQRPNSPGAGTLRDILVGDHRLTLSDLEDRFQELLSDAGLPLPETNSRANQRYVDCRWPDLGLTVELDSYTYHATRHAWERDRRREREARARGDDFRRFTSGDVYETPEAVCREMREALRA